MFYVSEILKNVPGSYVILIGKKQEKEMFKKKKKITWMDLFKQLFNCVLSNNTPWYFNRNL